MTVTVFRDKGVTVITMATDRKSMSPPLCQILKSLCYSPICCSVNRNRQTSLAAALGTIQIMVGLFNIGLGPGRTSLHPGDFAHLGVAYWLGGVFIAVGIMTLVAGRFPSSCLVGLAVTMNIIGSVFTIVGVVLYSIDIYDVTDDDMCDWGSARNSDMCRSVLYFFRRMMVAMDVTMIVLVVVQLFVCVGITISGVRALCRLKKEEGGRAEEVDQPPLKEVLMTSPGA